MSDQEKVAKKSTVTMQFSPRMTALLKALANKNGETKVEIVRRAIALYSFFEDEVLTKNDRKLAIVDSKGQVIRDIILAP